MLKKIGVMLVSLPRWVKRLIMVAIDLLLLPAAMWSAIALRHGELWPAIDNFKITLSIASILGVFLLYENGLYRAVIRHMADQIMMVVFKSVTLTTLILVSIEWFFGLGLHNQTTYIIYWAVALIYIITSRLTWSLFFYHFCPSKQNVRNQIVVYGAGEAGAKLAQALQKDKHTKIIGFIDDNKNLQGCEVNGILVYSLNQLMQMLSNGLQIDLILLAMPSISRNRRQEIICELELFSIPIKTIPNLIDIVSGFARIDELREIEIEDLLGRDRVLPYDHLLKECIENKVVMVTGAGGSIGSELCRQILKCNPKSLVLFEMSELALYQIDQELNEVNERLKSPIRIVPILGSVTQQSLLERILCQFCVQTLYHAAAYKHVPLVECNIIEGVRNNIFGTLRATEAARITGVETFVLISTDKAVRPTNVMGATKRFAELILQAYALQGGATRYCMVRFGNVLGSSGSVVPLFAKQISKGGPVTVTHPEINRYFMTIPEAAGLVLQASSMGKGGDVFVLDMGEPVKIIDLASRMIHLSGLKVKDHNNPYGDIEIKYTGLRPGEKLYEELLIGDNVSKTSHPLIMRAEEIGFDWDVLQAKLAQADEAICLFDSDKLIQILLEVINGYQPTKKIINFDLEKR